MDIQANRSSAKYSHAEQMQRVLWMYCGSLLFRFSPRTFFQWRNFILRSFGATIGKEVHIYNSVKIALPWNLEVDNFSAIGENVTLYNLGKISIGKNVTISQNSHLCAGSHDYSDPTMPLLKMPIKACDNVWVCADAFIGPNITLENNSIIAARSVVTKNVNANEIVAGNPAKFIKKRTANV